VSVLSAARFGWASRVYWLHPLNIIGMVLSASFLTLATLSLTGKMEPAKGFTAVGIIVFLKVGFKIWQNAVLPY
jgi:hypothetical protein